MIGLKLELKIVVVTPESISFSLIKLITGYLLSTEGLLIIEDEFNLDSSAKTGSSIVLLFLAAVFLPSIF